VLAKADVVQSAVVADGDDAGGVDAVVADSVMRRDAVAGGEGFGARVKGVLGCSPVDCPVWADGVVVGGEFVELGLQFGDRSGWGKGGETFFEGLVETFDFAAGLWLSG
jgi:hypothetical protein